MIHECDDHHGGECAQCCRTWGPCADCCQVPRIPQSTGQEAPSE